MFGWLGRFFEPPGIEVTEYWVAANFLSASLEGSVLVFPDGKQMPLSEWRPYTNPEQWELVREAGEKIAPHIDFSSPRSAFWGLHYSMADK